MSRRAVAAALTSAALLATPSPAHAEPIPRAASCVGGQHKASERQTDSNDRHSTYRQTVNYAECAGFDRVSSIRLDIWHTACGGFVVNAGTTKFIWGWRMNPDVIGDWNPPTWSPRCHGDVKHYTKTLVPPGDHYEYLFATTSEARRCVATKIVVDWRFVQNDEDYRTPAVCLDGR